MYVTFLFKLGNYPDILQGTDNQKMELLDYSAASKLLYEKIKILTT